MLSIVSLTNVHGALAIAERNRLLGVRNFFPSNVQRMRPCVSDGNFGHARLPSVKEGH